MRVLVIPTRWESEVVLRGLPGARPDPAWDIPAWHTDNLLMIEPGMGPDLTSAILPRLEKLKLDEVWLFGWCGGLIPELGVGDLVLADASISRRADGLIARVAHPPPDPLLAEIRRLADRLGRTLIVGPVLTSDQVLVSLDQKQSGRASGAVAVEMEAGPLAAWAAQRRLPFVHLRVVLDPLWSALPSTDLPADGRGYRRKKALFLHTLVHWREWPALWRLFWHMRAARHMMTEVIRMLAQSDGPLTP
ncbi:MAG: hypothetical protein Kow0063_40290 [Anaerolineae bacterium]